ncbi:MAG: acyl-CoA dehydratase activase, partial [Bacteroidota bacterium]
MPHRALGICVGASTVSFVELKGDGSPTVVSVRSVAHNAEPRKVIERYCAEQDVADASVVVTGRRLRRLMQATTVSEPEAVERAFRWMGYAGRYKAVASLGGETFLVYCLDANGNIENVLSGNKCASGTGEFFLQQIRRMNLDVGEATAMAEGWEPYGVSGRCSVFCKSDCTHALNKGIPKGKVVAGLCKMIALKIVELLAKQPSREILLIGGVSQNQSVLRFVREHHEGVIVPECAPYFEALGAAVLASDRYCPLDARHLFKDQTYSFPFLPPLTEGIGRVEFKTMPRESAQPNDICILGLDVGSTTTKAILLRTKDNALLASAYLRTNGNPVEASLSCYRSLKDQVTVPVSIIGLGTTGSGRHIAGLHALTKGVINEIIAHAAAAAYFDKEVDTIFEIGGQDAKYTYLTNGVASDYAMNEACSAGTGSFLEEAAKESLSIDYRDIAELALMADRPPNFNDQCAAFISSDIKTAAQEGITQENVVGGLVYSICMNYINRVKGNRSVGAKIFMQGGVCYNRAVPIAMATLIQKDIIVPPEPGLMGAYGVALEVKRRIELDLLEPGDFQLDELMSRSFRQSSTFECAGGEEHCDRKCEIAIFEVEGKKYPFGGSCNRFYDRRLKDRHRPKGKDYVKVREQLVFAANDRPSPVTASGPAVGLLKSFSTNTFFPLYHHFFTSIGFRVVLSDIVDPRGLDKMNSSFCFPVEIAHGLFEHLLSLNVDYVFLPHVQEMIGNGDQTYNKLCVFAQAEPYYLRNAFSGHPLPKLLTPVITFAHGHAAVERVFVELGVQLGVGAAQARTAFREAYRRYEAVLAEGQRLGAEALAELESDRHRFGIILFGR